MPVADERNFIETFVKMLPTEKGTVVARMHNSFSFAFGVLTLLSAALVVREGGFKSDNVSWVALNGGIVLLAHFFIRTTKDYLNQIRFAHLQKVCLAFLSGKSRDWTFEKVVGDIDRYYVRWEAPMYKGKAVKKSILEHGFGILLLLLAAGHFIVGWSVLRQDCYWALTLVAAVLVAVVDIGKALSSFYFRCTVEAETMKGLY